MQKLTMGRWTLVICSLCIAVAAQGCGEVDSGDGRVVVQVDGQPVRIKTERVTRDAWRSDWPFTVDEATLICVPDFKQLGVFFAVDGYAFAVTGGAETLARVRNFNVVIEGRTTQQPVTPDLENAVVDRLWAEAPRQDGLEPHEPWRRVGISGVLPAVMRLGCDD